MEICSINHEEIIHDEFKCPFCKYIEETENQMSDLENKIEELQQELEEVKSNG